MGLVSERERKRRRCSLRDEVTVEVESDLDGGRGGRVGVLDEMGKDGRRLRLFESTVGQLRPLSPRSSITHQALSNALGPSHESPQHPLFLALLLSLQLLHSPGTNPTIHAQSPLNQLIPQSLADILHRQQSRDALQSRDGGEDGRGREGPEGFGSFGRGEVGEDFGGGGEGGDGDVREEDGVQLSCGSRDGKVGSASGVRGNGDED